MKDFQVTKDFWFSELIKSNTAIRKGIDNTPTEAITQHLKDSCIHLWQPVRDMLNKPISVNCGYRSPRVNSAVGGSNNSAHLHGYAIDFICPAFGTPKEVAQFLEKELKKKNIKFDQLIMEFDSWVHLAWKSPTGMQRNQVLTASKQHGKTIYSHGV